MEFFECAPIPLDDLGPERIYHFYDPRTSLRAVIVIDTSRAGLSGGGVRMAPDLSVLEVVRLARAMSYKYALFQGPTGGAKAGIWFDPQAPGRDRIMAAFVQAIRPLWETGAFLPGPDMGTSFADLAPLYGSATPLAKLAERTQEGMPLEDQLTGYGVAVAAQCAAECLGRSIAGARVAIEGFGKVGSGAAKYLDEFGARIVGVSTINGSLYAPEGLDIARLLGLREQYGDRAIEQYPGAQRLGRQALFSLDVDVLVPGARPDALHAGNVDGVRAWLVVPAANIPYANGAVSALGSRNITAVPDFVSNAGGVVAVLASMSGADTSSIFSTVRERMNANVRRIFDAAREHSTSPYQAAVTLARQTLLVSP